MSYVSKKSGNVISNDDYAKLKNNKLLQSKYVKSDLPVPKRGKVAPPAEVKDDK